MTDPLPTEFAGFPAAAMTFLRDLRDNNRRDWFAAHRGTYDAAIKAPGEALVAALEPRLALLVGQPLVGKIFRIHRDVRFSKDKSPYNAHLHVAFLSPAPSSGGRPQGSGFYLALEPERLTLGAGAFELAGGALDRFRAAAGDADCGRELAAVLERLAAAGMRLEDPALKRVPAPYAPDHPHADLLRHKGLTAWLDITDRKVIESPAALQACLTVFETSAPLHRWLTNALG